MTYWAFLMSYIDFLKMAQQPPVSLFTTVCLISKSCNLKMHSQMCLCGSRVSYTFTTHKRCTQTTSHILRCEFILLIWQECYQKAFSSTCLKCYQYNTVMRCFMKWICSGKCVVRRFCLCVNVIEFDCTNLHNVAYYTPMLYGISYCYLATNLYSMSLY
jgi:hypothetical protein